MNRDLLKRYIPSCYEQALQGGPMPFHTGDTFRMGLGAGADYAGLNSFSCWEGGLMSTTEMETVPTGIISGMGLANC